MGDRLRVNPILCSGHGLCAELLPELITIDEWGYPIVSGEPIPQGLDKLARRAMTDCPALALMLVRDRELPVSDSQRNFRGTSQEALSRHDDP
jgi:ferredoxin